MPSTEFEWKRFGFTAIVVFLVSYLLTVVVFGILWDPNGARLLERRGLDVARIIGKGLYMSIPLAFESFLAKHPVPMTMGLGYLVIAGIGIKGRSTATGRAVLYALVGLLAVLGTVRLFLMA